MYIGAIDQGTTSTRFMIFDHGGRVVAVAQEEHEQIFPQPGWVEHDPAEIWRVPGRHPGRLAEAGLAAAELSAIGITNQRETTVVWDRNDGRSGITTPSCGRTRAPPRSGRRAGGQDGGQDRFRAKTGLPLATYFAGPKIRWILDHVDGLAERPRRATSCSAPSTRWLIWNLTGGVDGGVHVTDVTNASRTMLMDLETLDWDDELAAASGSRGRCCPRSASLVRGLRLGRRRTLGRRADRRRSSATSRPPCSGRRASTPGEAKNTYGTGCFMLLNTGTSSGPSTHGLLTTVGTSSASAPAGLRARRVDRGRRARSSSGCATTSATHRSAPEIEALAAFRRRQRRRLLRAGVLRAVRAALAGRRARRRSSG